MSCGTVGWNEGGNAKPSRLMFFICCRITHLFSVIVIAAYCPPIKLVDAARYDDAVGDLYVTALHRHKN
jgi:hypothetical protein